MLQVQGVSLCGWGGGDGGWFSGVAGAMGGCVWLGLKKEVELTTGLTGWRGS